MSFIQLTGIKTRLKSARSGYIFAIFAAALTGMIHSIPKPLLSFSPSNIELNPLTFVAIIYVINGIFFTPIRKDSGPISKIGRRNLLLIIGIGLAEVSGLVSYFFGLKQSTAINGSILTNGEIIFSILIALTIFKERLYKKEIFPFSAIIFGIILLPIGYGLIQSKLTITDLLFGNILILLSGVFCATDIILCKYVTGKLDPKRITQLTSFVGAILVLMTMVAFQVPFQVDLRQLPSIAMLGLFGTGFATFLFLAALKMIGTTRTVLLYSTNFIFGVIFAMVFLHESITAINLTSILFASVGIYLLRNRLGSIEQHVYPIEEQPKRIEFKNLCGTCQTHGCCTSISSPLLFPTDLAKLKAIKKDSKKYVSEVKIKDKTIKTIRKKENTTECTFWNSETKKCSIYNNRPLDCMIYPFDINLINGKYHWIVYSCNSKSDWKWSESYLHLFETSHQFQEILENIEIYHGLDKSSGTSKLDKFSYVVLREVNFNKLLNA